MSDDLKTIGRYEIVRVLGKGAMGVVYLCHDPLLKRPLAIKTVREFDNEAQSTLLRFQREAEISARLNHPNIVTIHDVGKDPQAGPFLAMEYVDGSSLGDLIKAGIPLETTFKLLFQAMRALLAAERAGITHRDVKPGNIMVGHDGRLKLMDFGIARGEGTRLTQVGQIIGTPSYTAPELLVGGEPNPASDRYAFAVTAFQMITGTLPFECTTVGATLFRIVHEPPLYPDDMAPEVREVFGKAFAKAPEDRPKDMVSFLESLLLAVDLPSRVREKFLDELESEPGAVLASRFVTNETVRIKLKKLPPALPPETESGRDLPTEIVGSAPMPGASLPTTVMATLPGSTLPLPLAPVADPATQVPSGASEEAENPFSTGEPTEIQPELSIPVAPVETALPAPVEEVVLAEEPVHEGGLGLDSGAAVSLVAGPSAAEEKTLEPAELSMAAEDGFRTAKLKLDRSESAAPVVPVETKPLVPTEETVSPEEPGQEREPGLDGDPAAFTVIEEKILQPAEIPLVAEDKFRTAKLRLDRSEPAVPDLAPQAKPREVAVPSIGKQRRSSTLVLAALILLAAGIGGAWLWQTRFAYFHLEIASVPEGARILLDGREMGRTNFSSAPIPRRGGTLRLEMEGYAPMEVPVQLGNPAVHVVLMRSSYPVSVVTEPAGAEVYLNDELKGVSPLPNLAVPGEGQQVLTLRLKDHALWTREMKRDEPLPAVINLALEQLVLRITSQPAGAEAFLNGKRIGKTPLSKVEVFSGQAANLTLKLKGYKDWQGTVNDGRPLPDPIYLVPMMAHFVVRTEPAGATVYFDGAKVGQTPLADLLVPYLGSHSIRITREGFQDWSANLDPAKPLPDPILLLVAKKAVQLAPVAPTPQAPKAAPPPEKKKGFWKKVFGGKDKKPAKEPAPVPTK